MVMSYTKAREYESLLQEEFDEDKVTADVTGGLPENPEEFDLAEAKEEFMEQQAEDESGSYDGPDPQADPWIEVDAEIIEDVVAFLKDPPEKGLEFGCLNCISGDHLASKGKLSVTYHLHSYETNEWVTL
ncbi:MAG: NADH-quinone oxidoreductase subunit C, partial [bacterium]